MNVPTDTLLPTGEEGGGRHPGTLNVTQSVNKSHGLQFYSHYTIKTLISQNLITDSS